MKNLLFFVFVALSFLVSGQKTKVLVVDLGTPHDNSITFEKCKEFDGKEFRKCSESKWLSVKSRELIALRLINGNPLKYNYTIGGAPVTFFMNFNEFNNIFKSGKKQDSLVLLKHDSYTYKNLLEENKQLKDKLYDLDLFLDKFRLKNINRESLGEGFTKTRDSLFIALKTLNLEAELNHSSFEKGIYTFTSAQKKVIENIINENIDKSQEMLKSFEKKYFFKNDFYTLPIDIQGKNADAIEFTIKRFDKETNQEDEAFVGKYKVWITGGLKIDISAGIFLTSLFDRQYETRDVAAGTALKEVYLKNHGQYDFAFGSTINTNFRLNSWIQPQVNFGAIFTQNQKFQMILGAGAILGREERWILSGGLSMGVVDRLADGFQNGGSYDLGTSGQIPMVKQFKFGHFIGITYNLSKVNTISMKPQ